MSRNKIQLIEAVTIDGQQVVTITRGGGRRTYRPNSYSLAVIAREVHVQRWAVRVFLAGAIGWVASPVALHGYMMSERQARKANVDAELSATRSHYVGVKGEM